MKKLVLIIISSCVVFGQIKQINNKGLPDLPISIGNLHINNVNAKIANNGWFFWQGRESGFIVPSPVYSDNENGYATIFASGLFLSGEVNGEIRTSIAYYNSDFTAGSWQSFQDVPSSINNEEWKIYYFYSESYIVELRRLSQSRNFRIKEHTEQLLANVEESNREWFASALSQGASPNPPGDAAVFYIFHDSNLDRRRIDQKPLNVQVRVTQWAYLRKNVINNTVFSKVEIINKNNVPIENLRIGIWSDADLGQFQDDLVGSDPELKIGYAYNGQSRDAQYTDVLGLSPPAVAYDVLQGPLVDSTGHTVIVSNNDQKFYFNQKGDDSFNKDILENKYVKQVNGFQYYCCADEPSSAIGWNNFLRSRTEFGTFNQRQLDAITEGLTSEENILFFFNGDPTTGSGWIDSDPSDRRFILNLEPFDLGVSNQTQSNEDPGLNSIIFATFTSFGSDYLNSVTQLKQDDIIIKQFFRNGLRRQINIPPPAVNVNRQADQVILNWNNSDQAIKENIRSSTESYDLDGFKFQGYQIGFIEDDNEFIEIDTFDIKDSLGVVYQYEKNERGFDEYRPFVYGQNSGIQHSFVIDSITLVQFGYGANSTFNIGIRAYAVNLNSLDRYETIRFSDWAQGTTDLSFYRNSIKLYQHQFGDILEVERTFTKSDGKIIAKIVNPELTDGSKFEIRFDSLSTNVFHPGYLDNDTIPKGELVWNLYENDDLIIANMPQHYENISDEFGYTVQRKGIEIKVVDVYQGFRRFLVTANAGGALDPPEMAAFSFNNRGFPTLDGLPPEIGVNDRPNPERQQENGSTWGIHTGNFVSTYRDYLRRSIRRDSTWSKLLGNDFELRFTEGDHYAVTMYNNLSLIKVPFEAWHKTKGYRLIVGVIDTNNNFEFDLNNTDHPVSSGNNDPQTDWFYLCEPLDKNPGDSGYRSWLNGDDYSLIGPELIGRQVLVNWNGGDVDASDFPYNVDSKMPETGTIFLYETNKPNTHETVFKFQSPVEPKIIGNSRFVLKQNYPNPFNPTTIISYDLSAVKHVRLDIFNVLGQRVNTLVNKIQQPGINKSVKWHGQNMNNQKLPVGVYFYRLQVGDHIETKKMVMIK